MIKRYIRDHDGMQETHNFCIQSYVTYKDHEKAIDEVERERDDLRRELDIAVETLRNITTCNVCASLAAVALREIDTPQESTIPEVRHNKNGTLDEVVAHNAYVHLEQMDDDQWWLLVKSGGEEVRLWFSSKKKVKALIEEEPREQAQPVEERQLSCHECVKCGNVYYYTDDGKGAPACFACGELQSDEPESLLKGTRDMGQAIVDNRRDIGKLKRRLDAADIP